MISSVSVENFQGFKDPTQVRLGKITLIFGPNATGKSSLVRALQLLGQSAEQDRDEFGRRVSNMLYEGNRVSLANFTNVIHKHEERSTFKIGLVLDATQSSDRASLNRRGLIRVDQVTFNFSVSKSGVDRLDILLRGKRLPGDIELSFATIDHQRHLEVGGKNLHGLGVLIRDLSSRNESLQQRDRLGYTLDDRELEEFFTSGREDWASVLATTRFEFRGIFPKRASINVGAVDREGQLVGTLLDRLRFLFSEHIRGIDVAPLREIVDRTAYSASSLSDEESTQDNRNRSLSRRNLRTSSDWLKKLTGGRYSYEMMRFQSEEAKFLGSMYSAVVYDNWIDAPVTLKDVGVGISQVMPILNALSAQSQRSGSGVVLIEQPELHLHPAMQADLAEVFVEHVQNSDLQVIAETHSESLLLRLLKLVRTGELHPEDLAVIYVDHDKLARTNRAVTLEISESDDFYVDFPLSFGALRLRDSL